MNASNSYFFDLFGIFLLCLVGICADIAQSKHEHWSSLAPLPFEVVISAGQKAKEESWHKSELTPKIIVGLCSLLN